MVQQNAQPHWLTPGYNLEKGCEKQARTSQSSVTDSKLSGGRGSPQIPNSFSLNHANFFFFNSLRNQWAGTDGKWEAAKGKKMVLERSAEPGAPLQVHPPRSRWHGLHWLLPPGTTASSAPPICCQDQMTILISSSARSACKSGATAHCTTYKVFCKHSTYLKRAARFKRAC